MAKLHTPLALFALIAVLALAACGGGAGGGILTPSPTPAEGASPTPSMETGVLSAPEVVKLLRPSVVHIQSEGAVQSSFGQVPARGVGTGVIVDEKGHIVTNNHVVRLGDQPQSPIASRIEVALSDGRLFQARVVGTDPPTDLAVLQIDASNLKPAKMGNVADLQVGEDVVAMGFALDLPGGPTATKGVVSAKDRFIEEDPYTIPSAIQTDAAINPGNSGGPLVNMRGEVVGLNTAIALGAQGIGLAISIDTVRPVVAEIVSKGRVERGFLGISFENITPAVAAANDLPVQQGVIITAVVAGSPAERAGLRRMDIMIRMNNRDIRSNGDLYQVLAERKQGEKVTVEYYRGREKLQIEVTLTDRPSQ